MATSADDWKEVQALVIDGNATSRSILVSQLRDFGIGSVSQCARLQDARRQLEYRSFDIVLCEHHFSGERLTGQDLLDDLRRNQLLPFSTVFLMITAEATYAKVAEAAESALDGYLLKPHKATQLSERLYQARLRKKSLQEIFTAVEAEDFETAAQLCQRRFEEKGLFWLYAARVGAELMLRTGQYAQAQTLYEAVIAAKTLPWAKLGVARSQLDAGQVVRAASTLENLISEEPTYSDAYDVLGRAQFELGNFDQAMATYKMASDLTPDSISRLQSLGMMAYYAGQREDAAKALEGTCRIGLDSKMFDCQSLVLLAFTYLERGNRRGLQRCSSDFERLLERDPQNQRPRRLAKIVDAMMLIEQQSFAGALDAARVLAADSQAPQFDFESCCNLLTLLAHLANKTIQLEEVESFVDNLGLRFSTSRAMGELLVGAVLLHPPYVERLRSAQAKVLKLAEQALTLSLEGNPTAAVEELLTQSRFTRNVKLIETAGSVLQRYAGQITNAEVLSAAVKDLRERYASAKSRPALGDSKRSAGGLTLRVGAAADKTPVTPN